MNGVGKTNTQCRNQRHGHGGGRNTTGIIGDTNNFGWGEKCHDDNTKITTDDQVLHRPALKNPEDTNHQGNTHGERDSQPQTNCVAALRISGSCNHLPVGCNPCGFFRNGNQRRFCNRCSKTKCECKHQQPPQVTLAHKVIGHFLTDGEQRHLQTLYKQGQAKHYL